MVLHKGIAFASECCHMKVQLKGKQRTLNMWHNLASGALSSSIRDSWTELLTIGNHLADWSNFAQDMPTWVNIRMEDPSCRCRYAIQTRLHIIRECPRYLNQRPQLGTGQMLNSKDSLGLRHESNTCWSSSRTWRPWTNREAVSGTIALMTSLQTH